MTVRVRALPFALAACVLASCSFGPRLQSALPVVRDVPVLAGLSPAESLARARTYLTSRQYGLAIELFRAAGRDPALEIDSLNGLAIAYDGIGRRDLAERYFQKALASRTGDERTRRNLAAFYAASGQSEKRQALLADAAAAPIDTQAAAVTSEPSFPPAPGSAARPVAAANADLRITSPLGESFAPLLVKAGFSDEASPLPASLSDDLSIACLGNSAAARRDADGAMRMFRISIGEVYIATEPGGTSCALAPQAGDPASGAGTMSNTAYLELLAAYLDRLNRLNLFAELALPAPTGAS